MRKKITKAEDILWKELDDAKYDLGWASKQIKHHTEEWVNAQKRIISVKEALLKLNK